MISLSFSDEENYTYFHCGPDANRAQFYATPISSTTSISSPYSVEAKTSSSSPSPSAAASSTLSSPTVTAPSDFASSSSATNLPSSIENQNSSNNNNLGSIIGGVIGGLALVCGSVVAVVYLLKRGKSRRQLGPTTDQSPSTDQPWLSAPPISVHGDKTSQISRWYPSELHNTTTEPTPSELPGMQVATGARSPVELPVYSMR